MIAIIKKHVPKCKIYLFGSRARKTHSLGSDIDLAIDAGKEVCRFTIAKINNEIEESNIPFFVDIVDMHSTSTEMIEQILKYEVLWRNYFQKQTSQRKTLHGTK